MRIGRTVLNNEKPQAPKAPDGKNMTGTQEDCSTFAAIDSAFHFLPTNRLNRFNRFNSLYSSEGWCYSQGLDRFRCFLSKCSLVVLRDAVFEERGFSVGGGGGVPRL